MDPIKAERQIQRTPEELDAWSAGYSAALEPNDAVCPYPAGPLASAWWDGYSLATDVMLSGI